MGTMNDAARGGAVAGRELDARVATEVFGRVVAWCEVVDRHGQRMDPFIHIDSDEPWASDEEVPPYSTEIGAAWEVLSRLRQTRGPIILNTAHDGEWTVLVRPSWPDAIRVTAATAPLAICLAALAATDPPRNAPSNAGTPEPA